MSVASSLSNHSTLHSPTVRQIKENIIHNIVEYLITKCELDPHISNDEGLTPLHLACWGGNSIAENVDSTSSTNFSIMNIFTKLWDAITSIRGFLITACSIDIAESREHNYALFCQHGH